MSMVSPIYISGLNQNGPSNALSGTSLGASKTVNTISDLIGLLPDDSGLVYVSGRNAIGDGGGGLFVFDPQETGDEDGGTLFTSVFPFSGRWKRVFDGIMDVRWFGAIGTDDDTGAVAMAVTAVEDGGALLFEDVILTVSGIELNKNIKIIGRGEAIVKHKINSTTSLFYSGSGTEQHKLEFYGIELDGQQLDRINNDSTRGNMDPRLGSLIYTQNSYKTLVCDGVIFRNHLRTSIWAYGPFETRGCKFFGGATHNGIQVPFAGYSSYIIGFPGVASSTLDPNVCTANVHDCEFVADSIDPAVLGSNPGGVLLNEQEGSGGSYLTRNRYEQITFTNNRCWGVGCSRNSNFVACLQTYNAGRSVIATSNQMYWIGMGGIICQRADDVVISKNIIGHGGSTFNGNQLIGIGYDPETREGSFPFTIANGRAGERHYDALIEGNIIFDIKQYGILIAGDRVHCVGNLLRDITASDSGVLVGINMIGNHIDVERNYLIGISTNAIYGGSAGVAKEFHDIRIHRNIFISNNVENSVQLIRLVGQLRISNCEIIGNIICGGIESGAITADTSGSTVTSSADIFTSGHVGRVVRFSSGVQGTIATFVSSVEVTISPPPGAPIVGETFVISGAATGIAVTNGSRIRVRDNYVEAVTIAYQFVVSGSGAVNKIVFERNSGNHGTLGFAAGVIDDLKARFNEFTDFQNGPASIGSVTNLKSFFNNWDLSVYDQNNVSIRPLVDSVNAFQVLTAASSVMFRVDTSTPKVQHLAGVFEINTVRVPDGSPGTPSIAFQSEIGAGLYRSGANQISFAIANAERVRVGGSSLAVISSSSAATPSICWLSDTNTGFYKPTDDRMGVAAGGVACGTFMSAGFVAGGETLNASAVLEATSTTKGFLLPRMTKAQRDAIATPSSGLMIYQTDNTPGVRFYEAGAWVRPTVAADP